MIPQVGQRHFQRVGCICMQSGGRRIQGDTRRHLLRLGSVSQDIDCQAERIRRSHMRHLAFRIVKWVLVFEVKRLGERQLRIKQRLCDMQPSW